MLKAGKVTAIVGGQFGSEAKGLAAGWLYNNRGDHQGPVICTTNAGAQAGHTTVMEDDEKFVCYHLPTIGVLNDDYLIYLNAGSIIDPELLMTEIHFVCEVTDQTVRSLIKRIKIHPTAAMVTRSSKAAEGDVSGGTGHTGSTMKGVGQALASKVTRRPGATIGEVHSLGYLDAETETAITDMLGMIDLHDAMNYYEAAVTLEIPQGTGLSLNNSPFYPKCTSRDCWLMQGLTDAGVHFDYVEDVIMVCRTFPIRVGHVFGPSLDDQTKNVKLGDSGPFYPDSLEIEWSDLPGVEPERTTVTKRVRRIATWSDQQYIDALALNRPTIVMLTFINYLGSREEFYSHVAGMRFAEKALGLSGRHVYSWGPKASEFAYSMEKSGGHTREGE